MGYHNNKLHVMTRKEVNTLRKWLRDARAERGITMHCMAEKLCISESYYCSIENGYRQRSMDLSLADKIGKALEIPIKQILKYEADMRSNDQHSA